MHVLREEHFAAMKDGAILSNAGHFDVEIDLIKLGELSDERRSIRTNLEEYRLASGKRILVLAQGRLVNLAAAEGHPADVMDMSFANQALAAEWILENQETLQAQVYRLPENLDREVATLKLASLGGGLEFLTPEQEAYLASWRQGT